MSCSAFFVVEFLARWYAVGLTRRHLFRLITILDFINLLPILVSPGLPFVPSTPLAAYASASFTGTAVALGHHVLAVDARPDHAQMITTSLKLNGLSHAATVAHAAEYAGPVETVLARASSACGRG